MSEGQGEGISNDALTAIRELLQAKRKRVDRLATTKGAAGESAALPAHSHLIKRPTGSALKTLMAVLAENGINIKRTSFDLIGLPEGEEVDLLDADSIRARVPSMRFIEVKTANQKRVKHDFGGFFFALTENEIHAAEVLGDRHSVLLMNQETGAWWLTSVPEILGRARSTTWQVSVQL